MNDDPARWPRVKEIFHSALVRPPHERADFLREACEGNLALRRDVESLLSAHAEAGDFAERPAIDAAAYTVIAGAALAPGFQLGPYRIIGPLDAGGMGEVYRARDVRLGREVAVKVLPTALSGEAERIARLQREARLLAALNHPHIATIHGLEVAAGVHAVVMELIEGPTLADRLSAGPLPLKVALEIARQIADALDAAHEKGIIHRDLKPGNIKLTADAGTVKVLDFGLAKALAQEAGTGGISGVDALTREGVVAGTPAYMSPEQAQGQRVDERSDVWAFGCVLYEMLTARPAFGRPTLAETVAAVLEHDPDWQRLPAHVPDGIRRLLRRCLDKDPRRRLHHIADARIEIEDAARGSAATESAPTIDSRRRERVLGVSTGVLALALAAALGALLLRSPSEPSELRVVEITTPWTADPFSFAISPDGRRLAFVADRGGQPALWVRSLGAANAQALPGTEGARRPFWSRDSRSIAFFAGTELKRINVATGSAQLVTHAPAAMAGAWGADGTILFSSAVEPSLRRVNTAGGTVDAATSAVAGSTGGRYPQFLPGGRRFLFFMAGPETVRGVYLGSLDKSDVTRLQRSDTQGSYVEPGFLLFVRQGTFFAQRLDLSRGTVSGEPITIADSVAFDPISGAGAFSASDAGVLAYRSGLSSATRLEWFDRSGNALGILGPPAQAGLSDLRLSGDGHRVAAERTIQNETALWLLDSTRQVRLTRAPEGRITRFPVWSPDGRRVAFASIGTTSVTLSVKPSGGGEEEVLLASPEMKLLCDWSPDGRFLLYYTPDPKTGPDLWVLPLETRKPSLFLKTDASEVWGQFSPDGAWVAYQSNDSGRFEIYVRPFPGPGEQYPISTTGGVYPRWSRDGKELYYLAPDGGLMAVPIRAASTTITAGTPTLLFKTRKVGAGLNVIASGHQYDVAPDGRFLINVEAESSVAPITLLLNWKP